MPATPQLSIRSLNSIRNSLTNMLSRYTDENKRLLVWIYGIRALEGYLKRKTAIELTRIAVGIAQASPNLEYENVVSKTLAYYTEFQRVVGDKDE